MITDLQQMTFDYGSLDDDTRVFVLAQTTQLHALDKEEAEVSERHADIILEKGQRYVSVRDNLPDMKFSAWLRAEFFMSRQTAYNYIKVYETFGERSCKTVLQLPKRVLYALAYAPDTVIEMVETGQIPATIPAIREAKQEAQVTNIGSGISELYSRSQGNPTLYTIPVEDENEGISTVITPVEIDRVVHDEDPLEGETEEDRYMRAVDTGTTEYYHDDLRREAFHKDEEERASKRDAHVMRVMGSSDSPEWYTPQEIVRLSIELLGEIDLDPCSNSRETPNVPARNHYTKEDDGLLQPWQGKVYLNPPYGSEIPQWVDKLVKSYGLDVTEAIALLPGRIDTLWFSPLYKFPMCLVRGRIQYENSPYHAPFPCVIVYLGNRLDDFIRVFGSKGPIMKKVGGR